MSGLGVRRWERLFIWLVIGLVIDFAYGRWHSAVRAERAGAAG